jgi:hypothetical protein
MEVLLGALKRPAVTLRVQLNGPCKNASSHVWPLLHASSGHSKFTRYSNTIRQTLGKSGENRIGAIVNTVFAISSHTWKTDNMETNPSFLDANGIGLLL